MLDACRCLCKTDNDSRPRGIVVKFVRRDVKEDLLRRKKRENRAVTTADIGYASKSPISINESLTTAKRRLMKLVYAVRRASGVNHLWTVNFIRFATLPTVTN